MTRLFLDASILIAGSASESGGSAFILQLCQKELCQAVITELILSEAIKNIQNKLGEDALERFYNSLKTTSIEIAPTRTEDKKYADIIEPKDIHVLASAIASKSDYLITLDRRHFFTQKIKQAKLPIRIATPKDFLLEYYEKQSIK